MNKTIFDCINDCFTNFSDFIDESVFGLDDEKENEDCKKEYYHCTCDKYENGNKVMHKEKIVKDGKVLKDEEKKFGIEDKKKEPCKYNEGKDKVKSLTDENDNLKKILAGLQVENKEMKEKINELESKFNKVKSLFN